MLLRSLCSELLTPPPGLPPAISRLRRPRLAPDPALCVPPPSGWNDASPRRSPVSFCPLVYYYFLTQVGRISSQASDLLREVLWKALQLRAPLNCLPKNKITETSSQALVSMSSRHFGWVGGKSENLERDGFGSEGSQRHCLVPPLLSSPVRMSFCPLFFVSYLVTQVGRISSQASDLLREVLWKALKIPKRRVSTQQPACATLTMGLRPSTSF